LAGTPALTVRLVERVNSLREASIEPPVCEGWTGRQRSGGIYASKANTLSDSLVDRSEIFADLANQTCQDNADAAVHRFT
jgi:hypothetical protein